MGEARDFVAIPEKPSSPGRDCEEGYRRFR